MTGSQEPRVKIEPKRVGTDGTNAGKLMAAYADAPDPWQQTIIDCWLGIGDNGEYTMTSAGLGTPRQNGKNWCIEAREFFGMVVKKEKILHTAHQVKTAKKSFKRICRIFENDKHPEIMALVKAIRRTNGEEAIELKNGAVIEFSARSRQAARGFDGISLVIIDEAQELTDDQQDAIIAVLAASGTGTRQIIYAGTPPYPGCPGTVFRRIRTNNLQNAGPHDAWHEWGIEAKSIDEINITDKTLWYIANPSMGRHLTEDWTQTELNNMSPDGFARERLGWWPPALSKVQDNAIDAEQWAACRSGKKKPYGKTAYGVKFSPEGGNVTLCGAVIPEEGPARISFINQKPMGAGTKWLADWINDRHGKAACVVIDGKNGVDVLIEKIAETWIEKESIIRARPKDVIAAASTLTDAIAEQTVTWYELQETMNESATEAIKRPISGGWGFGGEHSGPIEAAALAYWGAKTTKRDPSREMRIG